MGASESGKAPSIVESLQAEVGSLRQDLAKAKSLIKHAARKHAAIEAENRDLKARIAGLSEELKDFRDYMRSGDDD